MQSHDAAQWPSFDPTFHATVCAAFDAAVWKPIYPAFIKSFHAAHWKSEFAAQLQSHMPALIAAIRQSIVPAFIATKWKTKCAAQ